MSEKAFKVGDVVRLRSGSPPMTVREVKPGEDDQEVVGCAWFQDGRLDGASFFAEMLAEPRDQRNGNGR